MAAHPATIGAPIGTPIGLKSRTAAVTEPFLVRWLLIVVSVAFLAVFLVLPLAVVFTEAFRGGWVVYKASIVESDSLSAIRLTLITAAIAVPLNTLFGLVAGWAIARFEFRGKSLLI